MAELRGIRACVFDAYGTLFDFASAAARSADVPDARRAELSALWRDKQLQYTWLRSLQRRHADFEQVTGDALDFALASLDLATPARRAGLMALYRTLSTFPEVKRTLASLKAGGYTLAILSNGSPGMLAAAVGSAGLEALLDQVLSVEAVGVFKPDPRVYQLAVDRLGLGCEQICFVSSNAWDAYAASAFGMRVAWCNRYGQAPERLPGAPDAVIAELGALPALLAD